MKTSTISIALSGKDQDRIPVEGFDVQGYFVHHSIRLPGFATDWTVSHARSGQNLGARFDKRKHALDFARDMAANYNADCEPQEMFTQFRARGNKPSCADLAKKNHALGL